MKSDQVHVVAAAVFRDSQQVFHALEPRFAREGVTDVLEGNRLNRIDDDVALVHLVAAADFYVWAGPDANGGLDSAAPDSFAKALGENHLLTSGLQR